MSDPGTFFAYLLGFLALAYVGAVLADLLPHTPNRDDYQSEDELP